MERSNLFTRPRRFGKSLNMSMLKCLFEYSCDSRLFEGLDIAREAELCNKYMGKFPVISVSLKTASGRDYNTADAVCYHRQRDHAVPVPFHISGRLCHHGSWDIGTAQTKIALEQGNERMGW